MLYPRVKDGEPVERHQIDCGSRRKCNLCAGYMVHSTAQNDYRLTTVKAFQKLNAIGIGSTFTIVTCSVTQNSAPLSDKGDFEVKSRTHGTKILSIENLAPIHTTPWC